MELKDLRQAAIEFLDNGGAPAGLQSIVIIVKVKEVLILPIIPEKRSFRFRMTD